MLVSRKFRGVSRRQMLRSAAAVSLGGLAVPVVSTTAGLAAKKKLRILRWKNFVPAFETWFNEVFVKEWGKANDTEVLVENVGLGDLQRFAEAEIQAGEGHDLVLFLASRPSLEDHVIDLREVVEECQGRYGAANDAVIKSCLNPKTGRFHGFPESYAPTVLTYRRDLWEQVGKEPTDWEEVRKGGRAIKLLHERPVGISLAKEHNGQYSLRAILYAFGASVQDEEGRLALGSAETLEAIKYAKALYEEAMTPDVLTWTPTSNNRFMLAGDGNLTVDTMSVIRAAQSKQLPVNPDLALATLPAGPAGRRGPLFAVNTYVIWRFARNIPGAKRFLVDYVGQFRDACLTSGFQNMPSFPGAVPDLDQLLDTAEGPKGRYSVLKSVPSTLTNLGYPGYTSAATDAVYASGLVPKMFAQAATGALSPEAALDEAVKTAAPIFDALREAGKI